MRHVWVTWVVWGLLGGMAAAQGTGAEVVREIPDQEAILSLSRLDLGGYVQPELRYDANGGDDDLLWFQVRRGRVKVDYDLAPARFLLQLDATPEGVALKDAYGAIALPVPDGMDLVLMAGLFKIPFGFDLQYSSSHRVFPERSQMVRQLFPGERDVGIRLDGTFLDELLAVQIAVQNGVPLGDAFFGAYEQLDGNVMKDITLRLALNLDHSTLGVSGLYGEGTTLIDDDPTTPEDETDAFDFPHWAGGAELRYVRDLGFGELDLYGEVSYSRNLLRNRAALYPQTEDAEIDVLAWYAAALQGIGDYLTLGARFDQLRIQDADDGVVNLVTPVAMVTPTDATRVVLAYQIDPDDSGNNEGWLRLQVQF